MRPPGRAALPWHTTRPAGRRNPTSTCRSCLAEHQDDAAREIAQVYVWRDEKDKAFDWLDRAYAQRDIGLAELKANSCSVTCSGTADGQRF
jgi:hypothetical protein